MSTLNHMMCGVAMIAMLSFCGTSIAQNCNSGNCGAGAACAGGNCAGGHCRGGCVGGTDGNCGPACHTPCPYVGPSNDCIGAVGPHGQRYAPLRAAGLAAQDHYSPHPLYTYGSAGLDATRTDYWNRNTAAPQYAWHGDHRYWRWGTPTALVVPPTASFQTEYNWGVGQTRSMPIYHQFTGGGGVGVATGGGTGLFHPTPYWPNSTSQFGVYPVRGPW